MCRNKIVLLVELGYRQLSESDIVGFLDSVGGVLHLKSPAPYDANIEALFANTIKQYE